jgi:hypothetical protein
MEIAQTQLTKNERGGLMNHANRARHTTVSLAIFVLICFFMPWVQLSCMGVRDSVSGFDLAREGDKFLWFIPLFMLLILALGMARRIWEKQPAVLALASTVGGGLSAYLMYHERFTINDSPRLVATQWTALFWLVFLACLGIVAAAFWFYSRRARSP